MRFRLRPVHLQGKWRFESFRELWGRGETPLRAVRLKQILGSLALCPWLIHAVSAAASLSLERPTLGCYTALTFSSVFADYLRTPLGELLLMDIQALAAELAGLHPTTGDSYDPDAVIATAQLNTKNRPDDKTSMTGSEVLNAFDLSAYTGLAADKRQNVDVVLGLDNINPFGVEETILVDAFGAGSATIIALAAARKNNDVSRAVELGFGKIQPGNVMEARA